MARPADRIVVPAPASRHSAHPIDPTRTAFGLWAPRASSVEIVVDGDRTPMAPEGGGWWRVVTEAVHGTRYAFALDDGEPLPDPASRWLPDGVHAPAAVLDPARIAVEDRFVAPPVTGGVVYELHVGTFTAEGTFEAATHHLEELVELGVTHVEVMPVNGFDGVHGWGCDGVAWWAVHQPYGGPEGLAAFVTACHRHGLGVILDVVHNHLGPSGNHLERFGPYLQEKASSTWGKVVNLDGPDSGPVRSFIIGSALAWLRDVRVDGLRLDAVHALDDRGSATHLLAELSDAVAALAEQTGRRYDLIAETDRNDPQTIRPREVGGLGMDAQWADDLHHAIHVAVTGELDGYYVDYADPLEALARAMTSGFVHDGSRHSAFRGRVVGAPLPPEVSVRRLVACVQNHDQVGNRPAGDRLTTQADPDAVRAAIALLCTAPHTPMLFMGEEYGETRPFQFFTDMPGEELRAAIREGRKAEFDYFESWAGQIPDPLDPETFRRSTLDRDGVDPEAAAQRRALWRDLLTLRRTQPALGTGDRSLVRADRWEDHDVLFIHRDPPATAPLAPAVLIAVNLTDEAIPGGAPVPEVLLSTADARYGGPGHPGDGTIPARTGVVHALPQPAHAGSPTDDLV